MQIKQWLIALLGVALVVLLLQRNILCPETETPEQEPVNLIIATDLHYLVPELNDHGPFFRDLIQNADGKAVEYCEEIVDAFVEQVIAQAPDGVILSGDLSFNGARQSHEAFAKKLEQIRDAGIPVFVLPGNHDIESTMSASFQGDGYVRVENVTSRQFSEIYRSFGYQNALTRDPHSLSYTAQLTPALYLLMVDTNTVEKPGGITDDTLAWVEEQLADAQKKGVRVIGVSHQNLLQHNPFFAYGFVMSGNDKLLTLYERYGVICNLSGHMHLQHIAESGNSLPEFVTGSLVVAPLQYGVLTLTEGAGTYRTQQVKVSEDIISYAEAFFRETAYRQAVTALFGVADAEAMAHYFAEVNAAYFAGRMDQVDYDTDLLQAWKEQAIFLTAYLQSIAGDAGKDYTRFSFSF